ncbi:hypothetical protein ASG43_20465 [Aureimonas sp. Leaf454]|nr:hypothetical protein ASG43_20465 [Aureimonas sp. Leaf454]
MREKDMLDETRRSARETVTAFFETRTDATRALDRLRNDGVPVDEAEFHDGVSGASDRAERETHHKGFWEALGALFLPDEDRGTYVEALSRGGTLLTIPVSAQDRARVLARLDEEGTVDLDARQEDWRREGWGGPATSPTLGDTSLTTPRDDVALRSGISGIGAHAAGAPPARFARRLEDVSSRRVRAYRLDAPSGEARASEVEIEDRRRSEDVPGSGLIDRAL